MEINAILLRFEPLLKKLYYKYVKFDSFYSNADKQELKDEIMAIFIHIYHKWNPKKGVDFTGFIKKQLNDRVYKWVKDRQESRKREVLTPFKSPTATDDDYVVSDETMELSPLDKEEMKSEDDFNWIDAIESCPWEILDNTETHIAQRMLFEREDLETIAYNMHMKCREIRKVFYRMIDKIYNHQVEQMEKEEDIDSLVKKVSESAQRCMDLYLGTPQQVNDIQKSINSLIERKAKNNDSVQ